MEEKIVDSFSKTLNYEGCLFLQMNRIMKAMSIGDGSHTKTIEGLEALLSPYKDKKYRADMDKLGKNFGKNKKELAVKLGKEFSKLNDNDMGILVFSITKGKMEALMRLAARNRYLPETGIEDEI